MIRSTISGLPDYQAPIRALSNPPSRPTVEDFERARSAPLARAITTSLPNAWIRTLSSDPAAVWINETGAASSGNSVLYAVDFTVTSPFTRVSMDFYFAVDNALGAVSGGTGVYLNGEPLPSSSGGDYDNEYSFTWSEVTPLLRIGTNTLYVYARDAGLAAGVMFSAALELSFDAVNPLAIDIIGPAAVRFGVPTEYNIEITNYTLSDYPLVAVAIEVPDSSAIVTTDIVISPVPWSYRGEEDDGILGSVGGSKYLAYLVGPIPKNSTVRAGSFSVTIPSQSGGASRGVGIRGAVLAAFEPDAPQAEAGARVRAERDFTPCFKNLVNQEVSISLSDLTPLPCFYTILIRGSAELGEYLATSGPTIRFNTLRQIIDRSVLYDCVVGAVSTPLILTPWGLGPAVLGLVCFGRDVERGCEWDVLPNWLRSTCDFNLVQFKGSFDPNDKIGVGESGVGSFLRVDEKRVTFAIRFENLASASASARTVLIADTLDSELFDVSEIRIERAQVAGQAAEFEGFPANTVRYIDFRPEADLLVGVQALNSGFGPLFWLFETLDPQTLGPPNDPLLGFLPPNITSPEGEGGVQFSVPLRPGLEDGRVLRNDASIYFDLNMPIVTPEWSAVIDGIGPVTSATPGRSGPGWTDIVLAGSDEVSGVEAIEVYLIDDSKRRFFSRGVVGDTLTVRSDEADTVFIVTIGEDRVGNRGVESETVAVPIEPGPSMVARAGILQNPYLTEHLDVYVIASAEIDSATLDARIGTLRLGMRRVDASGRVWTGDHMLGTTSDAETLTVCGAGFDGRSRFCHARAFSSALISSAAGGQLVSPDGIMSASFPPSSFDADTYVLLIPQSEGNTTVAADPSASVVSEVQLSPANSRLSSNATVTFRLAPGDERDPSGYRIERVEDHTTLDHILSRAGMTAEVSKLGTYRLSWSEQQSAASGDAAYLFVGANTPNPFNPQTVITFELREAQRVTAAIYDVQGRRVRTLIDGVVESGAHSVTWNGRGDDGREVASGSYFGQVRTAKRSETLKLLLLR